MIGIVILAAALGGWLMLTPKGDGHRRSDHPYVVGKVERRDLRVGTSLVGTLGYGDPQPIPVQASGIVTWLPKPGHKAVQGSVLLRVDGRPVVLMYGPTPAYRAMHAEHAAPATESAPRGSDTASDGESASGQPAEDSAASVGPDVRQLEQALWALGFRGFTVDEVFTSGTAAAVKAWQSSLGVSESGEVELGDVVFLPGPIRLTSDATALGVALTPAAVQAQGLTRFVTVRAEDDSDWAEAGTRVRIKLPNGRETQGTVESTRRPSTGADEGAGGVAVQIAVDQDAPRSPTGEVEVTYVAEQRRQVLAVPVIALIALAEGGYAVQLDSGQYVAVTPGIYADGMVEVTGDISEAARIRVPR